MCDLDTTLWMKNTHVIANSLLTNLQILEILLHCHSIWKWDESLSSSYWEHPRWLRCLHHQTIGRCAVITRSVNHQAMNGRFGLAWNPRCTTRLESTVLRWMEKKFIIYVTIGCAHQCYMFQKLPGQLTLSTIPIKYAKNVKLEKCSQHPWRIHLNVW